MPLVELNLVEANAKLPEEVKTLLDEADRRINEFIRNCPSSTHGFVPSDYVAVHHALRQIAETGLAPGPSFCEWGSGFGIVTLLAAMLDFNARGIEVDRALIDEAETLAEDFELPVEFIHGSFVPRDAERITDQAYADDPTEAFLMATEADDAYDTLGLDVDDFDLVFAYPWPNEKNTLESLFEHFAADGALLLTYSHLDSMQLRRKVAWRR